MFENITTDDMRTQYATLKDMAGMEALAASLLTEIDARDAKAAREAATAATRALVDQYSNVYAGLRKSAVTEISDADGAVMRNARLTFRGLIS
jgi:hypothetical protein